MAQRPLIWHRYCQASRPEIYVTRWGYAAKLSPHRKVRTMLASPSALACVLLLGIVAGYFFAVRTIGIAGAAPFGTDMSAMAVWVRLRRGET